MGRKTKIPVDIRLRSERINPEFGRGSEGDPMIEDIRVSGTMKKTKDGYRIEFSDEEGVSTMIIHAFNDNIVSIDRVGPICSGMVFGDGRAIDCMCYTGVVTLQLRVRTKEMQNTLSLDGGKLFIDYSVEIAGNLAERARLSLSVCPDASILKS